ncbi:SERINE/THREONINE-PROTEIN KINASE TNNI3K-RELATED [Salix koriyanagi]|uniref:SERINE/THREONINE-PROTEIN KINASE TNNI3K-RELATED n=1 Tax=Salix koriyanagi TaxID=2511006 RepID=A0A9Q0ZSY7_9ROSI|nr:SERINE/THREONINE-PROTEIN KINASE TNNI3K-RELATED [Salix koriyanagi]
MIVAGWSQKKASTPCSPRQSPVENSPGKNEIPTIKTTNSGGCCRRLNDGAGKGSIVSKKENRRRRQRQPSGSELRRRYLDHNDCLEREVLKQKELRIVYMNLAFTIDQAKMNGWCNESREIEFQEKTGQGSTADVYRAIWRRFDVATAASLRAATLGGMLLTDSPNNAWVVTEILGMTLKEWLQGAGSRRNDRSVPIPPFHNRVTMALEIAQAMRYLHEQKPKVIHRM